MTSTPAAAATPLAFVVDETKKGSTGNQVALGAAGIVLAFILIIGQVTLALTAGISAHLSQSVANMKQGNKVMLSVIDRSAPSVELEKAIDGQSKTLTDVSNTMKRTNSGMNGMVKTAKELETIVIGMDSSSESLAKDISGMNGTTGRMGGMLGELPAKTDKTQRSMTRINRDTTALNTELNAIGKKMEAYGIPKAKGAPKS